jgi:PAS domain S-box-containing protein
MQKKGVALGRMRRPSLVIKWTQQHHTMTTLTSKPGLSLSVIGTLSLFGLVGVAILAIGRKDYPELHTILDTGAFLLSGVLALLLWDMSIRADRPFLKWSAISFALSSVLELIHALVTVEWSGPLALIAQASTDLRPATWLPSAYILAIGLVGAIWLLRRNEKRVLGFVLVLIILNVLLILFSYQLPRYSSPTWLGITRPVLILVPLLWIILGWICWSLRATDRLIPPLALMATVMVLAHTSMLYSRSLHDSQAMVAHLGKVAGYLVLLLAVMRLASMDISERLHAERELIERQQAELALRKSHAQLRLIIDGSPSAMLMANSEGRITLVNTQTETLFGYDRAELLDQPVEVLVPERYRGAHPSHRTGFFQRPSTRAMGAGRDLYGRRKDETEMPIEIGLNPITTDEGSFVLASIIDITERKRAEERFRLAVEASPSAILMINSEGLITLVNTQTEAFFGYDRSELLDQPVEMLVPERYRNAHPGHRTGFFQRPSTRAMGAGRDLYGRRKDGTEMPIEIGLNPIVTDEGAFVLASIIDITERKRADAEIHRLNDELELRVIERTTQLEAANKEMEAFSYSASHDLRAPLRHLAGFASLLQKNGASQLDENGRRYVNTIIEESNRMGDLIDHLLNFSRLGRAALQKRTVDLQQLLNEVVANTAVPDGQHINWTISDLPMVSADPALVRLVFENLLSNAVKFTRKSEEPQIEIGCSSVGQQFVLFVKDNGEGFDMRYIDKLFGVFQRLHRADEFEGTGIGLANVRRIISRHGGTTWAEGMVGNGATFFITLPR